DGARPLRDADDLHDLLRELGDLTTSEIDARAPAGAPTVTWLDSLARAQRVIGVRVHGEERWIAGEEGARDRERLGVARPVGVPPPVGVRQGFLEPVPDPVRDLVARFARSHGPFTPADAAARFGLGVAVVEGALHALEMDGRVVDGEFRPGGSGREWIDVEVLRRLRRRSLAALRKEIEPVPPEQLARFGLAWQGVGAPSPRRPTLDALLRVVEQLQGVPLPASALESQILPARFAGYVPVQLDQVGAAGELVWAGAGALGHNDGWIVLALAEKAALLLPDP